MTAILHINSLGLITPPVSAAGGKPRSSAISGGTFLDMFMSDGDVCMPKDGAAVDPHEETGSVADRPDSAVTEVDLDSAASGVVVLPAFPPIAHPTPAQLAVESTEATDGDGGLTVNTVASAQLRQPTRTPQSAPPAAKELSILVPTDDSPSAKAAPLAVTSTQVPKSGAAAQSPVHAHAPNSKTRAGIKPSSEVLPPQFRVSSEPPPLLSTVSETTSVRPLPMNSTLVMPTAHEDGIQAERLPTSLTGPNVGDVKLKALTTNASVAPASTSEIAWRQKWQGDLPLPGPVESKEHTPKAERADALSSGEAAAVPESVVTSAPSPNDLFSISTRRINVPGLKASQSIRLDVAVDATPKASELLIAQPSASRSTSESPVLDMANVTKNSADDPSADEPEIDKHYMDAATIARTSPTPLAQSTHNTAPVRSAAPHPHAAGLSPTIIDMMKTANDGPVELALSPEELGRLTISIQHDGDFVRISVTADRPETLDLMRRHSADLVADLRQSGFSGASLSFGQGAKQHQSTFTVPIPEPSTPQSEPFPLPESKPRPQSQPSPGASLDMRL